MNNNLMKSFIGGYKVIFKFLEFEIILGISMVTLYRLQDLWVRSGRQCSIMQELLIFRYQICSYLPNSDHNAESGP